MSVHETTHKKIRNFSAIPCFKEILFSEWVTSDRLYSQCQRPKKASWCYWGIEDRNDWQMPRFLKLRKARELLARVLSFIEKFCSKASQLVLWELWRGSWQPRPERRIGQRTFPRHNPNDQDHPTNHHAYKPSTNKNSFGFGFNMSAFPSSPISTLSPQPPQAPPSSQVCHQVHFQLAPDWPVQVSSTAIFLSLHFPLPNPFLAWKVETVSPSLHECGLF